MHVLIAIIRFLAAGLVAFTIIKVIQLALLEPTTAQEKIEIAGTLVLLILYTAYQLLQALHEVRRQVMAAKVFLIYAVVSGVGLVGLIVVVLWVRSRDHADIVTILVFAMVPFATALVRDVLYLFRKPVEAKTLPDEVLDNPDTWTTSG